MAKKNSKHILELICIAIFILFVFGMSIANLFGAKRDFSDNENRMLAQKPDTSFANIFSGNYDDEFENYFTDQFLARDLWIEEKATILKRLGAIENQGVYFGKDDYLISQFLDYDPTTLENNISFVNDFAEDNDVNINVLLVPGASYGEKDSLPFGASNINAKNLITEIYAKMPNLKTIDIADELANTENTYFKTDHHWNENGAYLAYQEICTQVLKKQPAVFANTLVSDHFQGTMYSRSGAFDHQGDCLYRIDAEKPVEIEVTYDDGTIAKTIFVDENLHRKDQYTYYLGGNHPEIHIKTSAENKKKAIILKDSYAHILMPYLSQEYAELEVIDLRYYRNGISPLLDDTNDIDIYLIYSLDTFVSDTNIAGLW